MSRFATRRLIDAAATLDSADQALLNIWINRGLDDAAMARLTGLSETAIAERRGRVIAHLSDELGLPPDHVRSALNEIAVLPDGQPDAHPAPDGPADPQPAPGATADLAAELPADAPEANTSGTADAQTSGGATLADEKDGASEPRRRRRGVWAVLALAVLIVAVVLVVALDSSSNGSGRRSVAVRSRARPAPQTVAASSTTTGVPASPSGPPGSEQLVALPGGVQGATGTVALVRSPSLRLNLRVSNLPPAAHGHYEIWLYDTVISSQPLGRLRNGVTQRSVALPGNAHRYPWIDISVQPPGAVFHSGDSILRAPNPLFTKPR